MTQPSLVHPRQFILLLAVIGLSAAIMSIGLVRPRAQTNPETPDYSRLFKADAVTRAIRDRSLVPVRVPVTDAASRAAAARLGTVIEDYKTYVVVAVPSGSAERAGGPGAQVIPTRVFTPGRNFDPLLDPPAETVTADGGGVSGGEKDYYVLQLGGPTQDEWLDSLRAVGVEILQYVPHQAFLVYGDAAAIQKAAGHSRVRWIGRYTADDKMSSVLREQLAATKGAKLSSNISPLERSAQGTAVFDLAIFARADLNAVAAETMRVPGVSIKHAIALPNNFFNVLRVEVPVDAVEQLAQLKDVVRIDAHGTPAKEDERSSQIVAGNYTSTTSIAAPPYNPVSQFGVDGTGVSVSVVDDGVGIPGDGGFYITAANAIDAPLHGATVGASGHGHLNATIIAGAAPFSSMLDPTGYNYGKGVAPGANIINVPLLRNGCSGQVEAVCYNDSITTLGPNGVPGYLSNNSWGNGTNANAYDAYTAQFDGFVRDASTAATIDPICLIFSAGNSGNSGLTRPKVAKNVISTGNSENLRTELAASINSIDDMDSQSSRGPAADGRIKPDITAPGTGITGGRSGTDALFGNIDTFHRWSEGTSHAAPQIAGAAALFTQWWKTNHSGANPSPALIKAAILNTGQEMNGVGSNLPLPNKDEGWGRINMKLLLHTPVAVKYIDQTVAFHNPGDSITFHGIVDDPETPVRVMLVWTDPPGTGDPALVNDLDLTVVSVGGSLYHGNNFVNGASSSGGTADTKNNVEAVRFANPLGFGANVNVTVSATALNGDGILGNADLTDQHFALVIYNFRMPNSAVPSDFDGDQRSDVAIFRPSTGSWYANRSSNGNIIYSQFGTNGDQIVPADYDGDQKVDFAVFRPSTGAWYVLRSSDNTIFSTFFGQNGDLPQPTDFDGDAKAEICVFRPSTGSWYYLTSSTDYSGFVGIQFGTAGDAPVAADYDGDGRADLAVWRSSNGAWYVLHSIDSSFAAFGFGFAGDKPVVGDYDHDGKSDYAVWRPSSGVWYAMSSASGNTTYTSIPFGFSTDIPIPGDYDGDGKTDQAVFRPSEGNWYLRRSSGLGLTTVPFGVGTDIPTEAAYVP